MTVDPAFHRLYEREFAGVFRSVFLMCGDRAVSEDATQEAFARALSRWRRLRHEPWAAGWVTTTALNVARRTMRRQPAIAIGVDAWALEDHDARLDLHAAIRALPPRQQEAVALHYLMDLPVEQTAASMGCDPGTVKTHLSRARAALARTLSDPAEPTKEPCDDHR